MNDSIKIFIDGACQPNPGNGGIGIFVSGGINEEKFSLPLHGEATNNVAEYEALIFALNLILTKYNDLKEVKIFSDSKLVCMQFNKKWKCKDKNLLVLLQKAQSLNDQLLPDICLSLIPREDNKIADELAKGGIRT